MQDTTEDEIKPEDMDEENFEDYSVGIRALATVSKGHDKLCFSLVCTNGIWIEKVQAHFLHSHSIAIRVGCQTPHSHGEARRYLFSVGMYVMKEELWVHCVVCGC